MSNVLLETLPIVLQFEKVKYGCDSSKQKYCIEFGILPVGEEYIFSTYIYIFTTLSTPCNNCIFLPSTVAVTYKETQPDYSL
jgi:hypothetical protein